MRSEFVVQATYQTQLTKFEFAKNQVVSVFEVEWDGSASSFQDAWSSCLEHEGLNIKSQIRKDGHQVLKDPICIHCTVIKEFQIDV